MKQTDQTCQVALVGAGPYGLAAAAHLRAIQGLEMRVFGEAMSFWERNMPAGMLLRSYWEGSHISDPDGALTLDRYQRALGVELPRPVRLTDFVDYGRWVQRRVAPSLDSRRVTRIDSVAKRFRLLMEDGESVSAERVVIATGIGSFAWRPPQFGHLPSTLVSHASEHRDFNRFAGQRVVVVGGGQSALESATLLGEAGAEVEVLVRAPVVRWLRHGTPLHAWLHTEGNPLKRILYPPSDIGPPVLNWIVDTPDLFRRLPGAIHSRIARRAIRPAAAGWLRPRLNGTRITTGRMITSAKTIGEQVGLQLDDGTERSADHVLLATGYRVDTVVAPAAALGPGASGVIEELRSAGAAVVRAPSGRTWMWHATRWRLLLGPPPDTGQPAGALQVADPGGAALILGALAPPGQEELAGAQGGSLASDLVVTPAHGAVAPALLAAARPRLLAVPSARAPRPADDPGVPVRSTALDGSLEYAGGPAGLQPA